MDLLSNRLKAGLLLEGVDEWERGGVLARLERLRMPSQEGSQDDMLASTSHVRLESMLVAGVHAIACRCSRDGLPEQQKNVIPFSSL